MVEKISLNVKIISLNIEHNFLVPYDMCVGDATALIAQAIAEEYPGIKKAMNGKGYSLMQASSGKLLNAGCSFKQFEIIQGEKFLLI